MDTFTLALFFLASVILLLGFAGQVIFKRTNIPDIIWLMLLGILLSFFLDPSQKALLAKFAGPFGTLALIMILFNSGLEFDMLEFSKGIARGLLLTVLAFSASVLVTAALMHYVFHWEWIYGALLGVIVGGTSSGVIIPIVTRMKGLNNLLKYILTIESTSTDIFVIVFAVTLIDVISSGASDVLVALKSITSAFSIGVGIGFLGALAWLFVLIEVEKEIRSYLLDFTVVLLLYVFTEFIGGSGAIAALTFGLVLGNISTIRKTVKIPEEVGISKGEKIFYSEVNFFIRSFFFVYLGVMFNFSDITYLLVGVTLVLLFLATRYVVAHVCLWRTGLDEKSRSLAGVMMARGLAAAVIAQLPYSALSGKEGVPLQVLSSFLPIVLSVILFSIIVTVAGVYLLTRENANGKSTDEHRVKGS